MLDHLRGLVNDPFKVLVWMYYAWRFTRARLIGGRTGSAFFTPEQPRLDVADPNKTPGGPPSRAPIRLGVRANRILARAVEAEFLADRGQQPIGRDLR